MDNQHPERLPEAIDIVRLARHAHRPTALDYIGYIFKDFIELHGDRRFGDDPAIVGGVAFLEEIPVTVIGTQKGRDVRENVRRNFGMAHPEGYRKAMRLMEEAEKFGRPVVSLIDTPGAFPGVGAEERGQAEAIARNLAVMSALKIPTVSVVTGEGGSGGALGIGVTDRIYMLGNAVYSVISPEGCASILWRDASKSGEAADALKLTARDLLRFRVIDAIIEEPRGGAHQDHSGAARRIKVRLLRDLRALIKTPPELLLSERYEKYRRMGVYQE